MEVDALENGSFVSYTRKELTLSEMNSNSFTFMESMKRRRSIRKFSDEKVPIAVIENLIQTASAAPSGGNKQPWTFCVVEDQELKQKIRDAAEKEEYINYHGRMSTEWKEDLKIFGTDWNKPYLTTAPYLIVVFKQVYELQGSVTRKNYYVTESVGIACGFLLAAIENVGLVALTHTPSPMNFLTELLNRPENEKPFLLIPVGYAAPDCTVPKINKKKLSDVVQYYL